MGHIVQMPDLLQAPFDWLVQMELVVRKPALVLVAQLETLQMMQSQHRLLGLALLTTTVTVLRLCAYYGCCCCCFGHETYLLALVLSIPDQHNCRRVL